MALSNYTPPIENGLSGDRYLEIDLEDHVEALADAHVPGCYALVCSTPEDVTAAWDAEFDAKAPYLADLRDAHRSVYVGAASNIFERLTDHVEADKRRSALLRVCPPHHVHDLWPMDSAALAFERESGIALRLQQERPEWYVHSR